jgi:putative membrane protein
MKRFKLTAIAASMCLLTGSAFAQDPRPQTGSSGSMQRPSDTGQHHGSRDSHQFVEHMAVAGTAEVQLGKLAQERASNPDVKAFGQMMVTDHSKANEELTRIASQLQINPPKQLDQKHKDLANRLSKLRGAEFDREYMNAMVEGHEKVASELKMKAGSRMTSNEPTTSDRPATDPTTGASDPPPGASRPPTAGSETAGTSGMAAGGSDQALTDWAAKTLPTVEQHLQRAKELQQKVSQSAR